MESKAELAHQRNEFLLPYLKPGYDQGKLLTIKEQEKLIEEQINGTKYLDGMQDIKLLSDDSESKSTKYYDLGKDEQDEFDKFLSESHLKKRENKRKPSTYDDSLLKGFWHSRHSPTAKKQSRFDNDLLDGAVPDHFFDSLM